MPLSLIALTGTGAINKQRSATMMAADVGHNRHNIAICIHFVVGYSDSPPIWSWPRRVGVGFCNFIRIEPTVSILELISCNNLFDTLYKLHNIYKNSYCYSFVAYFNYVLIIVSEF